MPWELPAGEAGEAPHPRLEPLREALARARAAEKERMTCGLVEVLPSVGEVGDEAMTQEEKDPQDPQLATS